MNEQQLVKKLYLKDEAAFAYIMDKYSKLLWYTAADILQDSCGNAHIEECISDIYFKLWQNPYAFDPSRGSLKNYLVLTTKSRAIDIYREKSRNPIEALDDTTPDEMCDASQSLIKTEANQHLYAALNSLLPEDIEILERRYVDGEKPSQICTAMNLPLRRVENRIYRAKQKLRKILGGYNDAENKIH